MLDDDSTRLIDSAIDDVARAMTSAPPRDGLARRVSMRIAEGGDRRTWWRRGCSSPSRRSACWCWRVRRAARVRAGEAGHDARRVRRTNRGGGRLVGRPFQGRRGGARDGALQGQRPEPRLPRRPALPPIEVERLDVPAARRDDAIDISSIAIDRIEISAMP